MTPVFLRTMPELMGKLDGLLDCSSPQKTTVQSSRSGCFRQWSGNLGFHLYKFSFTDTDFTSSVCELHEVSSVLDCRVREELRGAPPAFLTGASHTADTVLKRDEKLYPTNTALEAVNIYHRFLFNCQCYFTKIVMVP